MKRHAAILLLASLPLLSLCQSARADLTWEHRLSVRLGSSPTSQPIGSITLRTEWQGTDADPAIAARQRLLVRASASDFSKLPPLPLGAMGMPGGFPGGFPGESDSEAVAQSLLPGGSRSLMALFPEAPLLSMAGRTLAREILAQAQPSGKPGARKATPPVEAALVTDLANDRFVAYASPQRSSIGGPLSPTLKRVRFDPWKKLSPRLSQERPEELTRAQRARLGAEVRSVYRPFLKNEVKMYFHPLDGTRTIRGHEARGYRLAMLVNTGGQGGPYGRAPEWSQVRAEMWLAPEMEGDALVRSFNRQSSDLRRDGQSASMWLNEINPVLWQMMPQEILQAAETIAPPPGSPNEGFGGTPILMHLTFTPPPLQRLAVGETRLDLTLTGRSTAPIASSDFLAPAGYKATPLEPLLKQYEKSMAQMNDAFDKATPGAKPKPKAAKTMVKTMATLKPKPMPEEAPAFTVSPAN